MTSIFDNQGKLKIPSMAHKVQLRGEVSSPFVAQALYCKEGHNLLDAANKVNNLPSIHLLFETQGGEKGNIYLSPMLGDYSKHIQGPTIYPGDKVTFFCPEGKQPLSVLGPCSCAQKGDLVLLFLTTEADINQAIAFCNVMGCRRSMVLQATEIIHAMRLEG